MEKYKLDDQEREREKLFAFCGYGHYPSAKIAFMGNEEGLGGYELKYGIKARCAAYGNNPETYLGSTWEDGYYVEGEEIDLRFKEEMKRIRGSLIPESKFYSPMVEYQARIMLYIENGFKGDWFERCVNNPLAYITIADYYRNIGDYANSGLYRKQAKVGSALLDLRPLPRRDESQASSEWPYSNIEENDYNNAFDFRNHRSMSEESKEFRDRRANYLKKAIQEFSFPIIVGIGAKEVKKLFFEKYLRATFLPQKTISLTKNKDEVHVSEPLDGTDTVVILSDYFNSVNGIGLNGLRKLTVDIIQPIIMEKFPGYC
ncbi:hypothetical protein [Brevibacillus reuszeri]|uniref:hypothetical protein n=1 Tax=Brevibacillus reuszeri TaxID=54915 RepID=UPI000CCC4BE3|nr:hypothetical protein [Brevibacillus reuszeri]